MKKALALLLALVMCLSLVACGGNKASEEMRIESTEMSNTIAPEAPVETVVTEVREDLVATYPLLINLLGEWHSTNLVEKNDPFQKSIIINEDGTCVTDGKVGLWEVDTSNTAEGRVCISIHVDGTHIGSMMYWDNNKSISIIHTSFYFSPAIWEKADVTASSEPSYETVEITMENWQEYFEISQGEPQWVNDEFGELDHVEVVLYFGIKKDIADQIDLLSVDIIAELSWTKNYRLYTIDWDNKTFSIGEVPNSSMQAHTGSSSHTITSDFYYPDRDGLIIYQLNRAWVDAEPGHQYYDYNNNPITDTLDDLTVSQITGTIQID